MLRGFLIACVLAASAGPVTPVAAADDDTIEVLHFWTSGGEAAALSILKKNLEAKGVVWKDMPVAGGAGDQAMVVLRSRVTSGDPPTAAQLLGFAIQDWGKQGVLANLDEVAGPEGWDKVVPPALQRFSKYDGHWVAAPVNIHSSNWIFGNKEVLDKLGIETPTTWDDFIASLDKLKAAGYVGIAIGGQPWQETELFDNVVLATGGSAFYEKALIALDPQALDSDTMKTVFERLLKLKSYLDPNYAGRDWNLATAMVITGKAGFQVLADAAKGEFFNAKKVPGKDFTCSRFPGTQGTVLFLTDQFGMFNVAESRRHAQLAMASAIMDPGFQSAFNVIKGSVPARTDVSDAAFDICGKAGIREVKEAEQKGTLMGSFAFNHGAPPAQTQAAYDVIAAFFNGQYDPSTAPKELAKAIAASKE